MYSSENSDGFWPHKQGGTVLSNMDHSGNLIVDPEFADRDNLNLFVGYFALTPWNHMRSDS